MYMDEQAAVQMKIIRFIMLADNYCTRIGQDIPLAPAEALAYKSICDFMRSHARMMELHTLIAINRLERELYGEQPPLERRDDQPSRRVAERSDGQANPSARKPEEDDGLGDSPGGVPCG